MRGNVFHVETGFDRLLLMVVFIALFVFPAEEIPTTATTVCGFHRFCRFINCCHWYSCQLLLVLVLVLVLLLLLL